MEKGPSGDFYDEIDEYMQVPHVHVGWRKYHVEICDEVVHYRSNFVCQDV